MRTRSVLRVASLSFVILLGVGVGIAVAAPTTITATVKTAHSSKYGTLLVSAGGFALYQLGSESKGTIKCTGSCAKLWPPLLLTGGAKPVAGNGVSAARPRHPGDLQRQGALPLRIGYQAGWRHRAKRGRIARRLAERELGK